MYKHFSKINKNSLFFFLFVVLILPSCITSKKINYLQEPSGSIPTYENNLDYEEYVLSPFDKIYIHIYSADEKTNTMINGSNRMNTMNLMSEQTDLYSYMIDQDGFIDLPLVGRIRLDGLYVREAKKVIEKSIQAYMKDACAVDIRLLNRYFSVIGSDINGKFPIFKEKMNIFQALAMAGDISTFGDRRKIRIIREAPNGIQIKSFDVRSKDIINSEFYYIQPNDVIYIQEISSSFFSVTNVGSAISTVFTSVSFGLLIYNLATPKKKEPTKTETAE